MDDLPEGDSLLKESERYHHQAEQDHHEALKLAHYLRRSKHNSLFDPNSNALYDPILEEYVLPHRILMELKATEEDIADGIVTREDLLKRRKNESLFSSHSGAMFDPVLHEYTIPGTSMLELKALKDDIIKKHQLFNEMQMRREHNLENCGLYCDPLVHSYRMRELIFKGSSPEDTTPPRVKDKMMLAGAVPSTYRKLNEGDDLMKASVEYQKRMFWTTTE